MIRLGLCCKFKEVPIKFKNTTVTHLLSLDKESRLTKLSQLALANANALFNAIVWCASNKIKAFRVNSQILPVKSHPEVGYKIADLRDSRLIQERFRECGSIAKSNDIRLSFHPDQFVVLNSPNPKVVEASVRELEYHGEVAEWIGADVINIHAGGVYGDKASALKRFEENFKRLPKGVQIRLTLENDDRSFTPRDLLPICHRLNIPLVYDVHHHRVLPDELTIEEATELAYQTWNREPLFHISSPLGGWTTNQPNRHADTIDAEDFPNCWKSYSITVDIEAKAKEVALFKLIEALNLER
jgi:UV DNA damage endonuclease